MIPRTFISCPAIFIQALYFSPKMEEGRGKGFLTTFLGVCRQILHPVVPTHVTLRGSRIPQVLTLLVLIHGFAIHILIDVCVANNNIVLFSFSQNHGMTATHGMQKLLGAILSEVLMKTSRTQNQLADVEIKSCSDDSCQYVPNSPP